MAVNGNDVHICLSKILNYSWKTCVAISTRHPFASFSFLCLFVVYISFPSVFWFLIYSFPLVVSTCFILSISTTLGNGKKCGDNEREGEEEISDRNSNFASDNSDNNNTKKSYTRVHSVRRRRAKELKRDDDNNNNINKQHHKVEEKNAFITSTNFNLYDNIVDKKPLIEECAKEIRDVEVDDYSLLETTKSSSTSPHRQSLLKQESRDEKTTKKESLKNDENREFTSIIEQESHERTKSKPTIDNPDDDDDQIKEVIQVYENDIHNQSEEDATCSEVETSMPIPRENSSTNSNSPSSSEENEPVYKIDKEAILKSLSSMARRNVVQEDPVITDNNNNEPIMNQFNYNNCPFDACSSSSSTSTRLKERFYYGDKFTRRHARSFSIASDLQVEVSEVSSPPLTIDENYSYHDQDEDISSYDGDMEKKIPNWDDQEQDLWASSFRLSNLDDNEINEQDMFTKDAFSRINNGKRYCISSSSSTADLQEITGGGGTSLHDKIHEMFQYSSVNPHENKRKNRWNLLAHTLDGYESGTSVAVSPPVYSIRC
ncbi:hypothetical protein MIMGU_mgv1a004096mg [Erythranthe guttata]|uniref:Uncharacterized protein n=1 Tax=Erythranthe guttata TaxID=4155 RepID=A0A022RE67_ERYGU|nr:hypothetical protein MIMGU_mgv1a004096mg [Erythranthe guttata]